MSEDKKTAAELLGLMQHAIDARMVKLSAEYAQMMRDEIAPVGHSQHKKPISDAEVQAALKVVSLVTLGLMTGDIVELREHLRGWVTKKQQDHLKEAKKYPEAAHG